MKKDIIRLCILTVSLFIISFTFILLMGKTLTFSFKISSNNNKLILDDNDTVEVIDERKENNKYIITIKAKKPGKGSLYLSHGEGEYAESKMFYVHKTGVITDNNIFGYSSGSEIIPISLSIILIYILWILIKKYKKSVKENLYQYKNIAYLGIIIFLSNFTINNLLSLVHYQGIYDTVSETIKSISFLSFFMFPIALVTFILVTISNLVLIKNEGKSLRNILGLLFGIFLCLLTLFPNYLYNFLSQSQVVNIHNLNSIGPYLYDFVESIIYLIVAYLECVLIGTIVIATKSTKKKIDYNKDYMIILGCKIGKDGSLPPLLKGRVDRALKFRNEQFEKTGKELIFIPSGGKGKDEIISESEAMKKYLIKNGIKDKNIIMEDKSKNTYDNIKFSNKLIKKKNANIAFSTTNYHVLRAGLIANEQGLYLEGIGSKTKAYYWINAFIREFIGTLYSERKKHILVFILILIVLAVMISTNYLANNI